jgi:pantoate--beta-alanine ligase
MVEDLCMPIQVTSAPIHREADGLAMSSRNRYITDEERPKVIVLKDALDWIASQIKIGNRNFSELEKAAAEQVEAAGFNVDYLTCSNSKTLDLAANDDSEITILGAIFTESARLIDNVSLSGS